MAELKTKPENVDIKAFIDALPDEQRDDCNYLLKTMQKITGEKPEFWTGGMIGFGRYTYQGKTCSGEWFPLGFSPRKNYLSIYLLGYIDESDPLLTNLGKFKAGKGCLNIKRLSDIDKPVLEQIIKNNNKK
ncbi:MAG: hypothetical protein A2W93_03790 [Bacteroidetes bacterium GWF2_43_63]|nr:MAG: hypothetical protein A2W94_15910 [Bacteroidetes bacterium GWE2_42_42]OFY55348.1 MAG: hypothetical protein A2W93_03790 [Bacteroidetes bacterium GWF2_43_63]HBG71876.1 hypothetical protein [Bacteroidales bacterium]HCB61781.1 hypothetical protein [Bacteroidales bacterium]HCY22622.1 hypothetical protein [Bacteroidales bacterium]